MTLPDKRLLISGLLASVLALVFWSGSRYPDLNRKAAVGGDMGVSGLGFDVAVKGTPRDAWWKKAAVTAVNWGETNKKGMTFGLLMAAAILTVMSLVTRRGFENRLGNSLMGVLIGAPLGLCINCATPIASALHRGGARLETTLAALISSPSMNVIVVTMAMSLFPWYLWVTKVVATAVFVVVGIPLACRLVFRREAEQAAAITAGLVGKPACLPLVPELAGSPIIGSPGWWPSASWTARTFGMHLWWLGRTTVPLMILAGLLGSVMITVFPWHAIEGFNLGSGRLGILATMGGLAMLATFLPVPMAFDVVICVILFERGMPSHYVMVLLFTLGTFSVYPFMVLRRTVSLRVAAALYIGICAVGFASGVAVHFLEEWHMERQTVLITRTLVKEPQAPTPPLPPSPVPVDDEQLNAMLGSRVPSMPFYENHDGGVRIERHPFREGTGEQNTRLFTRHDGPAFGIDVPFFFSPRKFLLRSSEVNRPIASGDVHNDGWPDLLIGADHDIGGLLLFANVGGKRFVRQRVELGAFKDAMVQTAALVDLNGDGWLDIFFTTYGEGNVVVLNHQGRFDDGTIVLLSRDAGTLANAVAFGDLNRDGNLDLVIGNWTMGYKVARGTPKAAADHVLLSQGNMRYSDSTVEGPPGYTLSTLLTDFNDDGLLDLIVGNDFGPDNFYLGKGNGTLQRLLRSDNMIPATGLNTMSVTAADIDNDLRQELFLAQIAVGNNRKGMLARRIAPVDAVAEIAGEENRERLRRAVKWWPVIESLRASEDVGAVARIDDPWIRQQFTCFATTLIAMRRESREWASLLPSHCGASDYVARVFSDRYTPTPSEVAQQIPVTSTPENNLLLKAGDHGVFVDRASSLSLAITDWTWNARFADVDNDGWQDLYAATGWLRQNAWEGNMFLHNVNGATFRDDTAAAGLVDHLPTSGYTYVDLDLDGDLDIVSVPVLGPVRVFMNNSRNTHALQVELRDHIGNTCGIGSKIVIHYGPAGELHQMREIQASGGYVSFDAAVAHFGLGEHRLASRMEIRWSTGETTALDRTFDEGYRYIIHRQNRAKE